MAYNQAAQAEIRRARTKSIATYGELMAMTVAMLNEATVFSGTHGISGVSEMLAGLPGIRGGLVEALACYIDTEQCGTALEIGADALASAAERDFILSEPGQVLALMLKALRDRSAWVLHTEIVLVAIGAWGLIADITHEERQNLMALLDAGLAIADQNQNLLGDFD